MDWNSIKSLVYLVIITVVCVLLTTLVIFDSKTGKMNIKLGLDLKSGSRIVIELKPVKDPLTGQMRQIDAKVMNQTIKVLERRLNPQGNQEISMQPEGENRLVIEIPEVTNVKEAEDLIKQTAYLEFKEQYFDAKEQAQKWRTVMDGTAIAEADAQMRQDGSPFVTFTLRKDAAREFGKITERNVDKPLGIFFDDELIDAPNVAEPITAGQGIIHGGSMTLEDCQRLAIFLNAGALPVEVSILNSMTVSPVLGHISLMKSLIAGILGLILVIIYMIVFYRVPGATSAIALLMYSVVVLASMVLGKFVLTLPGIAGFILSVGMAVDANVLIFERLKEELWSEKSTKTAVDMGFHRAFSSIIDGHVTTFLGAGILFYFGSASIKGFGLTLMLGTFWSIITAIFFTRIIIDVLTDYNILSSRKLLGE